MRFYADLCVCIKTRFSSEKRGDPNGIRTRVTAVKGRCPRPLDDRVSERQISRRRPALQAAFSRMVETANPGKYKSRIVD